MLIGDEPEIGDGNLKNIEIPEDVQKKFHEIDMVNNKWRDFLYISPEIIFCENRDNGTTKSR